MPDPIQWGPCPAEANVSCSVITDGGTSIGSKVAVFDGVPYLMTRRRTQDYWLEIVAEVDGPVHTAVMRLVAAADTATKLGCFTQLGDLRDGRYVFTLHGHSANGDQSESPHHGAMGGDIGAGPPRLLGHYTNDRHYSFWVSDSHVMRLAAYEWELTLAPWDTLAPDTVITKPSTDPDGLTPNMPQLANGAVFWTTSTLYIHGTNVWTAAAGAVPFVRFPGDYTRGAADIGTDGTDLVWSQGSGKGFNDQVYPTRDIMAAPFTTDPALLQPRRLRSAPYGNFGGYEWHVGCGYAARDNEGRLIVVRLSDGWSWFVDRTDAFTFDPALVIGVTCDELFVVGTFNNKNSVARIDLDSLGPGMAPD